MQSRRDQQQNVAPGDPLLFEDPQDWRQQQPIGNWPSDIANQDAGSAASAGQLVERSAGGRSVQRLHNGSRGIR
jgi:hypothetical protein